jgi:fructose-1,6-bisphosphatase-3
MGAAAGNQTLIANVIRIALSYNCFDLLEDGYGINLRALAIFANNVYGNDSCKNFYPHMLDDNLYDKVDVNLTAKMHKAMTVIQLKLESQMISNHPEYEMDHRNILPKVNFKTGSIKVDGKEYFLTDNYFPTIDPENPTQLTPEEQQLIDILTISFRHSAKLQRHIKFLYSCGSMYKISNGNLMYHGCIPMYDDGCFQSVNINGKNLAGKELLDACNEMVCKSYFAKYQSDEQKNANDFMWYLWCGIKSPLYGKDKMAFFERYFIDDKELQKEIFNPYFKLNENPQIFMNIFDEFHINHKTGHVINGHVPVKIKDGESPIKAGGKLFVIDGGISKAYRSKTGIAGYTLIYTSHTLKLAEHSPFVPGKRQQSPVVRVVETMPERINIADTDKGAELEELIEDLQKLLKAYRNGDILEKRNS